MIKDEKIINFRERIRVSEEKEKEKVKVLKEKIVPFRLIEDMKARIKQLRKEYTEEQDIIRIAASEFYEKHNGDIEIIEYEKLEEEAKRILEELKKEERGNVR